MDVSAISDISALQTASQIQVAVARKVFEAQRQQGDGATKLLAAAIELTARPPSPAGSCSRTSCDVYA
jgi:hypothetical protein